MKQYIAKRQFAVYILSNQSRTKMQVHTTGDWPGFLSLYKSQKVQLGKCCHLVYFELLDDVVQTIEREAVLKGLSFSGMKRLIADQPPSTYTQSWNL